MALLIVLPMAALIVFAEPKDWRVFFALPLVISTTTPEFFVFKVLATSDLVIAAVSPLFWATTTP